MPKYEVTLTSSEVRDCKSRADAIDKAMGSATQPTYTELNVEHGHFVGACCEAAVLKWCREFGIRHERSNEDAIGVADEHDLVLWLSNGRKLTVDVKGSFHERAAFLMIPFAQFDRHVHDAYIGCTGRIVGDQVIVIIHGIASRATIKDRGALKSVRTVTVMFGLRELTMLEASMFQRDEAAA